MNGKLRVLTAGVLFFTGQFVLAQQDTTKIKTGTIDEVIVVGYNSKKADEIVQAQSTITGKELKQQSNTLSLTNMLQGKAPGVLSQTSSGQPGSAGTIFIRGLSNFTNTQPLVVIDGQYSSIFQMNALNPSEVESQTILKDAAATAQYGSRAASGVIVITTKRGSRSKTSYTLESRFGTSFKVEDSELNFKMMNSRDKLAYENNVAPFIGNPTYTPADIELLAANDHTWENDVLRNSIEESYLFSASGGSDKSLFYYSLGYDKNSGIVRYLDGLTRYSGRFNFENKLSDKVTVGINASGQYQKTENQRDRNNAQNPFRFMYDANPYETVFLPDGSFNPTNGAGFPVLEALQTQPSNNKNLRLNANVFGEYKFTNYLKFRSTLYNTYAQLRTTNIVLPKSYLDVILGYNGQISIANNDLYYLTTNNRLDFNKKFGKHKVDATVFYEYAAENTNFQTSTGRNYRTPGLNVLSNLVTPITASGTRVQTRRTTIAGLLDYGYDQRYLLSGSVRRDGSSRFGADSQYGIFWSAAAAWNVAKEAFMDGSKFKSLKFRASYGIAGNDAPLPDYANKGYVSFGLYGPGATTVAPILYGNTKLEWEKVAITNLGLDFDYNSRLKGSVEVFNNKRTDFLQQIPYDDQLGGYNIYDNAGDLENRGIEIDLSADVIRSSDWGLQLRGNYSQVENKILSLRPGETERNIGFDSKLKVGEKPFFFRLVRNAGVDPLNGDALYYTTRTVADPGEVFQTTANGTVTNNYDTRDIVDLTDKSPFPKAFGGFGGTLTYKNFDITADFTYKYGAYSMNYVALNMLDGSQYDSNKRTDAANFWKNPGDTNVLPRPSLDGLESSDYFLQKTDYIRFRSLNVGYTFDKAFLGESVPVDAIRVYAQAQNLFIWTKYEGDPEVAIGSGESNTDVPSSYSLYTYPTTKTVTVGVELQF